MYTTANLSLLQKRCSILLKQITGIVIYSLKLHSENLDSLINKSPASKSDNCLIFNR